MNKLDILCIVLAVISTVLIVGTLVYGSLSVFAVIYSTWCGVGGAILWGVVQAYAYINLLNHWREKDAIKNPE